MVTTPELRYANKQQEVFLYQTNDSELLDEVVLQSKKKHHNTAVLVELDQCVKFLPGIPVSVNSMVY